MTSRKNNPNAVVTSAAYLLFYRRRASKPLGGPFFESMRPGGDDPESDDPSTRNHSRNGSPSALAGEGKRLDDFSRNGSSSALIGVGAAHQAGGGGLEDNQTLKGKMMAARESSGLPDYSQELHDGEQTLESMEVDDEQVRPLQGVADAQRQQWDFSGLPAADPVEDVDEPLFDDASIKAVSSGGTSFSEKQPMSDFEDEPWEASAKYGTPENSGFLDGEAPMTMDDEEGPLLLGSERMQAGMLAAEQEHGEEDEVVEVRLEDREGEKSE